MAKKQASTSGKGGFKWMRWVWFLVLSPLIFLVLMFLLAAVGAFGKLPTFEELENPKSNLASVVYSTDGQVLGKYYVENRTNVQFEDISINVIDALISTEDERFYQHSGIDAEALARVVKGIVTLNREGGGSTITQQLAKNLFSDEPDNIVERILQKFQEWVIALRLERNYTKKEILTMYLNVADFGHNIFGINSASKIYFDKTPSELSQTEAALLVGLLKAPTRYSPKKNPERSQTRRNVVLLQMVKHQKLTREEYDKLKEEPVIVDMDKLNDRIEKNMYGHGDLGPYFLEELKKDLNLWCKKNINPSTGKPYNLFKDGLRVYTTIDSRMQKYAEQAQREHMAILQNQFFKTQKNRKKAPFAGDVSEEDIARKIEKAIENSDRYKELVKEGVSKEEIEKIFNTKVEMRVFSWKGDIDTVMSPRDSIIYYKYFLHNSLMAMNPHTGEVKAWVGGINFRHFKYDQVRFGKQDEDGEQIVPGGGRQVGSTFKPFVYMMAMQEGRSPCEMVPNVQVCIEQGLSTPWCPKNSGKFKDGQMITMREALANSVNYISAFLMKQYGPDAVVNMVRKMGITSKIEKVPSICLGTADISVYEMVAAYSTFFNKGIYSKPIFLTRIEDRNGNVLAEFFTEQKEVLDEQTAYLTVQLMKGVVLEGTAGRLRGKYKFTEPVAGKTGTTQNNSDGWFIAGTPDLVAGVWTGGEDKTIRFASTALGQGANMALPVWGLFMRRVYDDKTIELNRGDFWQPSSPLTIELNCKEYMEENAPDPEIDFDAF